MALLEHSDRAVLDGLLALADLGEGDTEKAEFHFPAPGEPQGVGEIRLPGRRVLVAATAPGQEPPAPTREGTDVLVVGGIASASPGSPEVRPLSWERLDRWLAELSEQYDPESRTGFLLRQFRAFLPEAGITYFPGFGPELLDAAPRAHRDLAAFFRLAEELFSLLQTGVAAGWPLLRTARAEDLLAGFCFRDYAGAGKDAANFVRIALNLEASELQIAVWLEPGGRAHQRLRTALAEGGKLADALRSLAPEPVLWLWSAEDDRKIPAAEVDASLAETVDWDAYTVAVQVSRPFADLAGEGLPDRIAQWVEELLRIMAPVLTDVLH